MITVRYFAAAKAAAGLDEERIDPAAFTHPDDDGAATPMAPFTLGALLETLLRLERPGTPSGAPELSRVLSRSSFLVNGVAAKDHTKPLSPGDMVDVLPPFAGG